MNKNKFSDKVPLIMRKVQLGKTKEKISVIGQGTWGIKQRKDKSHYEQWKKSLRRGIELGMTHIDTAEFYGHGISEKVVGEVIKDYERDELFITTKLFPMHLRYKSMKRAAYRSLKRLDLNYVDLYLIHWPSTLISIRTQMKVMDDLLNEGMTRYIGVSNFSVEQFEKAQSYLKKGELVNNQLHANIKRQKHIHKSLPYYQKNGITLTAYSPLGHRGFTNLNRDIREKLNPIAKNHNSTIQQVAIAWLITHENVITIPKAFHLKHLESNAQAADIKLSQNEISIFYKLKIPELHE